LVFLVVAPILVLAGLGGYYLVFVRHWGFVAWWPMAACFGLAYALAWYWQRRNRLVPLPDFTPPLEWTDRDRQAWKLVEARARAAQGLSPDRLTEFRFYVDTGQELALELARAYHPGAADPVGMLTIPEILTVIELASHDLAELV